MLRDELQNPSSRPKRCPALANPLDELVIPRGLQAQFAFAHPRLGEEAVYLLDGDLLEFVLHRGVFKPDTGDNARPFSPAMP